MENWSKACTLKNSGGLWVRNMLQLNRALLGKWLWRFAMERDALWRKVVDINYGSMMGAFTYVEFLNLFSVRPC
jgi:hypothetical protein